MCISLFKWGTPTHLANKIAYTRGMNICARAKIKIRKTKQQIAIILWWFLHLCLFELKFTSLDITSVNLFWLLAARRKTIKIKKFWRYFFLFDSDIFWYTFALDDWRAFGFCIWCMQHFTWMNAKTVISFCKLNGRMKKRIPYA